MTSTAPFSRNSSAVRAFYRATRLSTAQDMDWSLGPLVYHVGKHLQAMDFARLWGQPYSPFFPFDWSILCTSKEPHLRVRENWSSKWKGLGGALWGYRSPPLPQLSLGPEWLLCKLNLPCLISAVPWQGCSLLMGMGCLIWCFPVTLVSITQRKPWHHQPCPWKETSLKSLGLGGHLPDLAVG